MAFDWRAVIGTVAPTLATALGGPLAGMAVSAIGSALGLGENASEAQVSSALAVAKPELLVQLRQADQDFKKHMADVGVKLEEIVTKDRDSARQMQVATKARTPAILSWMVVLLTGTLYSYMIMGDYEKLSVDSLILGRILGTLDMAFGVVLAYWLGAAYREPANRAPTP